MKDKGSIHYVVRTKGCNLRCPIDGCSVTYQEGKGGEDKLRNHVKRKHKETISYHTEGFWEAIKVKKKRERNRRYEEEKKKNAVATLSSKINYYISSINLMLF